MRRTKSSSSSPRHDLGSRRTGSLIRVPLGRLERHPANSNIMDEGRLAKLAENIEREGEYPPLVTRPHPDKEGYHQILDGHQRKVVLERLGDTKALCYSWPCDDATALTLLATLNRLEGQDDALRRAELLRELTELAPAEELANLLPESAAQIRESLQFLGLDLETLLDDLQKDSGRKASLVSITFAVTAADAAAIEEALGPEMATLDGPNRRGRALGAIARDHIKRREE